RRRAVRAVHPGLEPGRGARHAHLARQRSLLLDAVAQRRRRTGRVLPPHGPAGGDLPDPRPGGGRDPLALRVQTALPPPLPPAEVPRGAGAVRPAPAPPDHAGDQPPAVHVPDDAGRSAPGDPGLPLLAGHPGRNLRRLGTDAWAWRTWPRNLVCPRNDDVQP